MEDSYKTRDIDEKKRTLVGKLLDKFVSRERQNYKTVIEDIKSAKKMTSLKILTEAFIHLDDKTTAYLQMKKQHKAGSQDSSAIDSWLSTNKTNPGWAKLINSDTGNSSKSGIARCFEVAARQLTLCANSKSATSFPTDLVMDAMKNACERIVVISMETAVKSVCAKSTESEQPIFDDYAKAKKQLAKSGKQAIKALRSAISALAKTPLVKADDVQTAVEKGMTDLVNALNKDAAFRGAVEWTSSGKFWDEGILKIIKKPNSPTK